MLTGFAVEGFKGFRNLSLDFGRKFTIFIGPNGTGKSSVFQALTVLKRSINQTALSIPKEWATSDSQIAFGYPKKLVEEIAFTLKGRKETFNTEYICRLVFETKGHRLMKEFEVSFYFDWKGKRRSIQFSGKHPEDKIVKVHVEDLGEISMAATWVIPVPIGFEIKETALGIEEKALREALNQIFMTPEYTLASLVWVPVYRGFPQATYPPIRSSSIEFAKPEEVISEMEYRRLDWEERLCQILRKIAGVEIKTHSLLRTQIEIEVVCEGDLYRVNIPLEGSGVNQLLWLFIQLFRAEPNSIILVEEPEIHLHPKAQAALVRLLATEFPDRQFILSTHSEHILYPLLTMVTEGVLNPETDLMVWAFYKEEGVCMAERVEITPKGLVKGGLPGFWEASTDALKAFVDALARHSA